MFREGQALRPTKSEWDSAVLEGLCGERGCCPFAMVVEWKGSVQREGQARQGCLKRVCPKVRKDAKQIKHTQTLTLRKASGIVQMQNHISTQTIAVRKVIEIVRKN